MFYKYMKSKTKKDTHIKKESIVSILLKLPDVIRHFKGSKVYWSTLDHKKS